MDPVLRAMTSAEIAAFRIRERASYVDDMIERGGMAPDVARARAEASDAAMFPGDQPLPKHHFLIALRGTQRIGELWFGPPPQPGTCDAWIYALEVEPDVRGQGLGRWLLEAGEACARAHGVTTLGLNVFGGNTTAIRLYASRGYTVTAQQMVRSLV
ncbi:MAG: GNAT family N-acetyltransferase [Myxococcota bacterium]|nr:GNAT family N-acetyltransferase [Myxococcota bacterium]